MAQRSKRAAARKGKQKRGKTPKKKTAKRLAVKTMPKKRASKAKPRTAKKAAARKPRPRKQEGEAPAERQTLGIAITLAQYLVDHGVAYDLVPHPRTVTASASAAASRVAADSLAKAVVLKRKDGFMLAVLPASRHIQFEELRRLLGGDLNMASEEQVETLFLDCKPGAVPCAWRRVRAQCRCGRQLGAAARCLLRGRRPRQFGPYQRDEFSEADGGRSTRAVH
jgi:Ala-tRNA(Pro) deacylase